jgi:uncharacterized membrane protein
LPESSNSKSDEARRVGGSGDIRLIGILVAVTLALGVMGILAVPVISVQDRSGDFIEQYTANLHRDGTLEETYIYTLKSSDTRMLFRYWEDFLEYDSNGQGEITYYCGGIVLVRVEAPPGSIAYVKNNEGQVTIPPPSHASVDEKSTISELAYLNEAGCYNPGYFPPGSYTISYTFKINFWLDSDGVHDHLNLMLARQHLPYRNVRITLEDADYISEVFQHPPSLKVTREGDDIVISGSSAENELLEFEVLMNTGTHGFRTVPSEDSDIKVLTEQANSLYSAQYWAAIDLRYLTKAAVLLTPFLFVVLWIRYGREEDVIVPPYLSTVPNPERKPWLVNLVFRKDVSDLDENGFYATLLDLDRRNKIKIEPREEGMRIDILDTNVEDSYEQRVIELLRKLGTLDVTSPSNPQTYFDTDTLKELASKISSGLGDSQAVEAQKDLLALTNYKSPPWNKIVPIIFTGVFFVPWVFAYFFSSLPGSIFLIVMVMMGIALFGNILEQRKRKGSVEKYGSKEWAKVSEAFFVEGRRRLWPLAVLGALLLVATIVVFFWASIVSYLLWMPMVLGTVVLVQGAIAYSFPSTLFGRWRDGMFKEKLEWDAFRAHLNDYSQLSRYSTEDLSIWGSWLVYGTALGVGDKVAKAMQDFNIKLESAVVATTARKHFHPMITASQRASSGGGKGHKGGGGGKMGGGGGRGRGGAGRR